MSLFSWFRSPEPRVRDRAAGEESALGFTSESIEAGRMIECEFHETLFDLAANRALGENRYSVTADDVEACVAEAARRIAAAYAEAAPFDDARREETAAAA